jgi:DNA repair protein RecN (Recombination protein N)
MTEAHQVICITHLPQVAAFADAHYAISKEVSADRTRTQIRTLTIDERVDELAAMLDGTPVSEHSRANAREIIERALALKVHENAGRAAAPEPSELTTEEQDLKTRELQSAPFKS